LQDITNTEQIPANKTAVALGIFDGIHRGHQDLINTAISHKKEGLSPAVFTFNTKSVTSKGKLDMLISDRLKCEKLDKMGIEYIYSPDFLSVKGLTAECFVKQILHEKLNASVLLCGENFHFGKGAFAGSNELVALAEKYGMKAEIIPYTLFNGKPISSSEIRRLIGEGSIDVANFMLGYDFHFRLPVVHGNSIGRTLDFPTINQYFPQNQVIPRFGVYASTTYFDEKEYFSITNIGVKPTIGGEKSPLAETYIIDYEGDLYERNVTVSLKKFIRPEQKFAGIDELKSQLKKDLEKVKKFLYFDKSKGGFNDEQN